MRRITTGHTPVTMGILAERATPSVLPVSSVAAVADAPLGVG